MIPLTLIEERDRKLKETRSESSFSLVGEIFYLAVSAGQYLFGTAIFLVISAGITYLLF